MSSIRTGLCVLVAFAVLAHGAVEPWSEAVLEIGAAVLLLIWVWKTITAGEWKLVWNPLLWPLLAFWLVAAIQLIFGLTAVPFLTRIELLKYSALLALLFLCVQSYRTRAQWRNFVWFLMSLGLPFPCSPSCSTLRSMENCIGSANFSTGASLSAPTSTGIILRAWWSCSSRQD
jgi:hypothetical protein